MDISSKSWRNSLKVNIENNGSKKHVRFEVSGLKSGPFGYFIGFDGRKTSYIGLTSEEKRDWMEQMAEPDIQERLDSYIKEHQHEER